MFEIITHAHRGFAYLILGVAFWFLFSLLNTMFSQNGEIRKGLKKATTFTMILFHLQFLIGLGMLFTSPGFESVRKAGMLMSDNYARHTYVEHPASMLIAAVIMTILNKKFKTLRQISLGHIALGAVAVFLFLYAFPFQRFFGA